MSLFVASTFPLKVAVRPAAVPIEPMLMLPLSTISSLNVWVRATMLPENSVVPPAFVVRLLKKVVALPVLLPTAPPIFAVPVEFRLRSCVPAVVASRASVTVRSPDPDDNVIESEAEVVPLRVSEPLVVEIFLLTSMPLAP